jgi:tetrathionate reductase subunit C
MNATVVQIVSAAHEASWLPWAVQYFFLIGVSVGAFVLSLPGIVLARSDWQGISRRALLAALICGLTAPVALLADLHQPGRFLNFYVYANPSSWMAWGAFFIPLYVFSLVLYAWLAMRPVLGTLAREGVAGARWYARVAYGGHESRSAVALAAVLAAAGGAAVLVYTGMEVMVVRARVLWHTPIVPLVLATTAFAGACGLVHVLNAVLGCDGPNDARRVNRVLAASLLLTVAAGVVWLASALTDASAAHAHALSALLEAPAWRAYLVWAGASTGVALWLATARPQSGLAVGVLAIAIAWTVRWALFIGGQGISKIGQGYEAVHVSLGPDGVLGIVGTLGLWLFLYIILVTVVPWDDRGAMKGA